jgi:acetyl esterase/lipase
MGHSAGAYIAAMLAIDDRWLNAVDLAPRRDIAGLIGLAGPYDFLPIKYKTVQEIFGGATPVATQPITYVSGDEPPAFLATAANDDTVNPGNSARLARRLKAAGDDVQLVRYPGGGHLGIIGAYSGSLRFVAPVVKDVDNFIARISAARGSPRAGSTSPAPRPKSSTLWMGAGARQAPA